MVLPKDVYEREDCFAHKTLISGSGTCTILNDLYCKYQRCSFYKKDIDDPPSDLCKKRARQDEKKNVIRIDFGSKPEEKAA